MPSLKSARPVVQQKLSFAHDTRGGSVASSVVGGRTARKQSPPWADDPRAKTPFPSSSKGVPQTQAEAVMLASRLTRELEKIRDRDSDCASYVSSSSCCRSVCSVPNLGSREKTWQPPTHAALGRKSNSGTSSVASMRTPTTVRDFYKDESRHLDCGRSGRPRGAQSESESGCMAPRHSNPRRHDHRT